MLLLGPLLSLGIDEFSIGFGILKLIGFKSPSVEQPTVYPTVVCSRPQCTYSGIFSPKKNCFFLKNFENILATALKSYIKWLLQFFSFFFFLKKLKKSWKPIFFRAKNATVSILRSGTDYCWLYCVLGLGQAPRVQIRVNLAFRLKNSSDFFKLKLSWSNSINNDWWKWPILYN